MITPSYLLTATERVLPKLALDFTTASLDNRVTFARTTGVSNPATYVNSSGLVTTATNNQPRFDYDPTALVCKGLLIEESRTNLCLQSSFFNTSPWTKTSGVTVSTDVGQTNPTGSSGVDVIANDGTNTFATIAQVISSSGNVTVSLFVKQSSGDTVFLRLIGTDVGGAGQTQSVYRFNFSTATLTRVNYGTATTTQTIAYGNGWYRISLSFSTTTVNQFLIYAAYSSAATNSVYVWGAQLEAGAFATSYIPTTTTALTRNADMATMTGTNFSDWFNASEGTFVASGQVPRVGGGGFGAFASVDDGTNSDAMELAMWDGSSDSLRFTGYDNFTGQWSLSLGTYTVNTVATICGAYKVNSFLASANGGATQTDVSGTVPTVTIARIGASRSGSNYINGWVRSFNYYPFELTSAEVRAFSK